MHEVVQILENRGLIGPDNIERTMRAMTADQLHGLQHELYEAIIIEKKKQESISGNTPPSHLRFFASQSMRGDSGCSNWECRLEKAKKLGRYAALYADKVIMPVRLATSASTNEAVEALRFTLTGTVLCLNEIRPVVEQDAICLVSEDVYLCSEHAHDFPARAPFDKALSDIYERSKRLFRVEYRAADDELPLPTLLVHGPEEYLEHGRVMRILRDVPAWATELPCEKGATVSLSPVMVEQSGVLQEILYPLMGNGVLHAYHGVKNDAKCLTDLPGEAELLQAVGQSAQARDLDLACGQFTHSVPLLSEVPLRNVLEIRQGEPEAFIQYRAAVRTIVHEHLKRTGRLTETDAREIFGDVLQPEIANLQAKVRTQRLSVVRSSVKKGLFHSAIISVGVWCGFLPSQLSLLFQTLGGYNLLQDLGSAIAQLEKNPAEVRNHNLYFLLRLQQEID